VGKQDKELGVSETVVGIDTSDNLEEGAATDMISEFVKQTMDNIQHEFEEKPDSDMPNK
jgi:hypothetical protein